MAPTRCDINNNYALTTNSCFPGSVMYEGNIKHNRKGCVALLSHLNSKISNNFLSTHAYIYINSFHQEDNSRNKFIAKA